MRVDLQMLAFSIVQPLALRLLITLALRFRVIQLFLEISKSVAFNRVRLHASKKMIRSAIGRKLGRNHLACGNRDIRSSKNYGFLQVTRNALHKAACRLYSRDDI